MRLAILMANTDVSDFARGHPDDGQKFSALIATVRPTWECTVFLSRDGEFPENLDAFDGFIVTGSPASVHDGHGWIDQLEGMLRAIVAQKRPLFGACFGHQLIAQALGGTIGPNPGGWVLGCETTHITARQPYMAALPEALNLYAAHVEQITTPPPGIEVLCGNAACPIGGFAMGRHVYTTQYHPEMQPGFIAALTQHLEGKLPPEVIEQARASLQQQADTLAFAESIAAFFEQAR